MDLLKNAIMTNFGYNLNVIDHLNEPYDYSSIMHYGPYAFSGSGKKTIVPRKSGAERMGQRIAFSDGDLRKINKLYQCNSNINGNSIIDKNQLVASLTVIKFVKKTTLWISKIALDVQLRYMYKMSSSSLPEQ
ncbi:astacin [Necator americanus]|uniref:Metalloendopeptidase n=1 Tax=Necator americanus TaxID=51031 RepID=W2T2X1_NECAM|nr:astacin [Necator americanus]ETN75312.1 astacin [Necator americanus]